MGYRSYGTSYTFFSESFEAKYLDSQAPPLGLPMKAIRFYTRDAAEEGERISGTFGTLLLYAEADRLAFFVLSLFPADSPMTVETVLEQISRIPRSDGCDPDRVRAEIVESIQMLKDYKLIQAYEDWSDQEETAFTETGYHLTAKGHLVQGYVIRWESFRRLHTILDETLTEGKLYPLDYYVQLAKIPEIFDSWHTVLMTYEAGEKRMGECPQMRRISIPMRKLMQKNKSGRSTGHSVTSTSTTSMLLSSSSTFLPGSEKLPSLIKVSSTHLIVSQTVASPTSNSNPSSFW